MIHPSPRLSVLLSLFTLFFAGCLSIDQTLLRDQSSYRETYKKIEGMDQNPTKPGTYQGGVARVMLTPPQGLQLAGYGKRRSTPSQGQHDPLYARALVLQNGEQTIALVTVDLLAITNEVYDTVYDKVSKKFPLSRPMLMLSASHTHSGPGGITKKFWESFAAGPYHPEAFERLTDQMAQALLLASENLQKVKLGWGKVKAPEWIRNRMIVNGPVDSEINALWVKRLDNTPLAVVVNYSAHATLLKPNNLLFSGDYPGAMEKEIETKQGGVALFTAGAVADQTPFTSEGADDFERVEGMGKGLANKLLTAKEKITYYEQGILEGRRLTLVLPPVQLRIGTERRVPKFVGGWFFDKESVVQILRIGPTLLVGVPADLSSVLGQQIKAEAEQHGFRAIIVGFANDYIGYVLPTGTYYSDSYEARMSFNGPYMGEYLVGILEEMMGQFH